VTSVTAPSEEFQKKYSGDLHKLVFVDFVFEVATDILEDDSLKSSILELIRNELFIECIIKVSKNWTLPEFDNNYDYDSFRAKVKEISESDSPIDVLKSYLRDESLRAAMADFIDVFNNYCKGGWVDLTNKENDFQWLTDDELKEFLKGTFTKLIAEYIRDDSWRGDDILNDFLNDSEKYTNRSKELEKLSNRNIFDKSFLFDFMNFLYPNESDLAIKEESINCLLSFWNQIESESSVKHSSQPPTPPWQSLSSSPSSIIPLKTNSVNDNHKITKYHDEDLD
jgi:hypothetical protein